MHHSTFEYVQPTEKQTLLMAEARQEARAYAETIVRVMPDGPDKTYALRKLREIAMWVNLGITRQPDGSPRTEE
jgi:hypothetical protein